MSEACPFRYPREKKRYISYFHRRREKLKGETIQLTEVLGLRPPSIHYKPLSPSNIVVSRKLSWVWCPITTRAKRLTWILVTLYIHLPDQLTSVKTAEEEYYPWDRLSHVPTHTPSSPCQAQCSVVPPLSVAVERLEEVVEEVEEGVILPRVERAVWSTEEEKGVAVMTSVRCRELKVTFTPTPESQTS